jgi:hypothetical protein
MVKSINFKVKYVVGDVYKGGDGEGTKHSINRKTFPVCYFVGDENYKGGY